MLIYCRKRRDLSVKGVISCLFQDNIRTNTAALTLEKWDNSTGEHLMHLRYIRTDGILLLHLHIIQFVLEH